MFNSLVRMQAVITGILFSDYLTVGYRKVTHFVLFLRFPMISNSDIINVNTMCRGYNIYLLGIIEHLGNKTGLG